LGSKSKKKIELKVPETATIVLGLLIPPNNKGGLGGGGKGPKAYNSESGQRKKSQRKSKKT